MSYKYLFGPVLSRRLGVSLGVDLVPHKYCTMDCIYCEVGKTTNLSEERDEYISKKEIIAELKQYLSENQKLDYITFSGAGEPTLNQGIGEIISLLKDEYRHYKIALITNSTLLADAKLRSEIAAIDLIMPSLDAVSEDAFNRINRPCAAVSLDNVIEGLISFRKESSAKMWLEVFIVPGINDNQEELSLLKQTIAKINPDRVQLNSLDRPGTEETVDKVSSEKFKRIAAYFSPFVVDILTRTPKVMNIEESAGQEQPDEDESLIVQRIMATVSRRPCTAEELSVVLKCRSDKMQETVEKLEKDGVLASEIKDGGRFYKKRS